MTSKERIKNDLQIIALKQLNEKYISENRKLNELNVLYSTELDVLCCRITKLINYVNEMCLSSDGYCAYGDDLNPKHIVDILKGDEKK